MAKKLGGSEELMFNLQRQIKRNNDDLHGFVDDMNDWQKEMNKREKDIKANKSIQKPAANNLPPIRNKIDIQNSLEEAKQEAAKKAAEKRAKEGKKSGPTKEEAEKYKRDNTPMPDYYKNWDKLAK